MKIKEVESFPKALLKKKKIPLYRAFIIKDADEVMNINSSIDLLAITKEDAVIQLVNELPEEEILTIVGKTVSFAVIELDRDDLLTKDVVDNGDVCFEHNILSVTLKDKIYNVKVEDMVIENIHIIIDPKTERKICTDLQLSKR